MPDVFLSYSREDQAIARQFAGELERAGFSVWWDQTLSAGESFDRVTEKALAEARAVVVLWSKSSVESDWVRAEATQGRADHRLVPVTIGPCKRPIMFELTQTADLSGWRGDASDPRWCAFIEGLRRFTGAAGAAGGAAGRPAAAATPVAPRRRYGWIAATAAAALALLAGLSWYLRDRPSQGTTATAISQASIAVLPFDDLSPAGDQGYFADGVAEQVLNELARIDPARLRVIARNSSFALRGRPVSDVGTTLDVDHVLEGSVRKAGEQLRVTAQLINARNDAHLWSRTWDRPLTDIFAVQDEIARAVTQSLQVTLGVGIGDQPFMTRDVEAYDAFLAAQAIPDLFTRESQLRRIELLEQALRLDPGYGVARSALAGAYLLMPAIGGDDAQQWIQKGNAALDELERQFPEIPIALERRVRGSFAQGRWKEAAERSRELDAATARFRDGNAGPVDQGRLSMFVAVGRNREAIVLLERAKARDPLNQAIAMGLAFAYASAGDFTAAFAEHERADRLAGNLRYVGQVNALQVALAARDRKQIDRWAAPLIQFEKETPGLNVIARDFHQRLLPMLDRHAESLDYLRRIAKDPNVLPVSLGGTSAWIAYHGDSRFALELIGEAIRRGFAEPAAGYLWFPLMAEARRQPWFKQYVREAGFVDYWREFGWGDYCRPIEGSDDFDCH